MMIRFPGSIGRLAIASGIVLALGACGNETSVTAGQVSTDTEATTPDAATTSTSPEGEAVAPSTASPPLPETTRNLPADAGVSQTTFLSPPETEPEGSICDDPAFTCQLPDGSVFDDRWVATVTLECGSEPALRRVAAFDAETAGYGDPILYTGRHQSGGVATTATPSVGDEIAVDGLIMFWQIQGVLLGPWPPNEIIDTCDDPDAHPITEADEAPRPEPTEKSP